MSKFINDWYWYFILIYLISNHFLQTQNANVAHSAWNWQNVFRKFNLTFMLRLTILIFRYIHIYSAKWLLLTMISDFLTNIVATASRNICGILSLSRTKPAFISTMVSYCLVQRSESLDALKHMMSFYIFKSAEYGGHSLDEIKPGAFYDSRVWVSADLCTGAESWSLKYFLVHGFKQPSNTNSR